MALIDEAVAIKAPALPSGELTGGTMIRAAVVAAFVGGVAVMSAQSPDSSQSAPAFEAASVKRSGPVNRVVPGAFLPNGQWSARGATLAILVRSAYDLDRFEGMPAWAYSERFDIVTTATPGTPVAQLQAMARKLLADRFELRTRLEQRNADVYALVRAKSSGPLGPGLRPAAATCQRSDPVTGASVAFSGSSPCTEPTSRIDGGGLRFQFRDRPLNDLLIFTGARSEIGGPIVDRTGLVGRFDIDLEFESRSSRERNPNGLGVPFDVAVERQLGLRFERRMEPVDVLVIEHVTMPSTD